MDMNHTTQVTNNNEMEVSQRVHCSFFGDPLTIFIIAGISMFVVSLIGIVGNILTAIVLSRPAMRTSTNIILLGLSVCDFMFVFMAVLLFALPYSIEFFCLDTFESFYLTTYHPITFIYFRPLMSIAQLGSTYFTVCVTVERFFVVYRPLMARPYCTNKNAIRVCVVITAFTLLTTLPTWWEYSIESVYDESGAWTKYQLFPVLEKSVDYVLFTTWVSVIVYRLIPMTVLTLLNISIYLKIRHANKMRETMTHVNSSDTSLAKMLILIVTIFIVCNALSVYFAVGRVVSSTFEESPQLVLVYILLFNLNSSVNFIIYCCMAKKFRLQFLELFWPEKWRGQSRNNGDGRGNGIVGPGGRITHPQNIGNGSGTQARTPTPILSATTIL